MDLDPRCSERGVDAVLAGIRQWLLSPEGQSLVIPVISENQTFFTVNVTFNDVESWQEMADEVQAENLAYLFGFGGPPEVD